MNNRHLVSVIIPTYNRAGVIGQAVDSVLDQTYRNVEVIVVDDGSTDETQKVLVSYGNRIHAIRQSNAGPAAARNRGLQEARGEYVAFQDSDDIWLPNKLERQIDLLEKLGSSVVCCICNMRMLYADGTETTCFDFSRLRPPINEGIWLNPANVLATRFLLFNQGLVMRLADLRRSGGFKEIYLEDYELSLRLALDGYWGFIRDPLVVYHDSTHNSWTKRVYKDESVAVNAEAEILRAIGERLPRTTGQGSLRRYLRLRRNLLWLSMLRVRMGKKRGPFGHVALAFLCQMERYIYAILRRSPWYPKMEVIGAGNLVSDTNEHREALGLLRCGR